MYFNGTIKVDPSNPTNILTPKKTGIFQRLSDLLLGQESGVIEQETFHSIQILQGIYPILESLGITNVVKFSHDDILLYHDKNNTQDDLEQVLMDYQLDTDHLTSELFQKLDLQLEHNWGGMDCLITIQVKREHQKGEYPIFCTVKGMVSRDITHKKQMAEEGKRFLNLLNQLDFGFQKYLSVDDVLTDQNVDMVLGAKDMKGLGSKHSKPDDFISQILDQLDLDVDMGQIESQFTKNGFFSQEQFHYSHVQTKTYTSRKVIRSSGKEEEICINLSQDFPF